jgi:hypothetical protein
MIKNLKVLIPAIFVAGAFVGMAIFAGVISVRPDWFGFIDEKLKSIKTPMSGLTSSLSPVRDLRGTWKSSLAGKGFQVFGRIEAGTSVTTIYEDGDIEIIIEDVVNNTATGKIRYTNVVAKSVTTAPNIKPITVELKPEDTGYLPISIAINGTALDFGTVATDGVTISMKGMYLTDILSGTMTATVEGSGELKGVFTLNRQK